jgi:hypothetical protein
MTKELTKETNREEINREKSKGWVSGTGKGGRGTVIGRYLLST